MSELNLLSLAFLENKPGAAAALLQEMPPEHIVDFLRPIPVEILVPVIEAMASWPAARTLSLMPAQLAADILRGLPHTGAESLLRLMSDELRLAVVQYLPAAIAKNFNRKLAFPLSTVGAWMDTAIPHFALDSSVEHCLDLIKRRQIQLGGIVMVVDDRHRLAGLVTLEQLLISNSRDKLVTLLNEDISPLSARSTLWEVEYHTGWKYFPTLPVIDHNNIVLGALTHSALRSGTARSISQPDTAMQFSILGHMGKAFFVSLGGLLQALSGSVASPAAGRQAALASSRAQPPGDHNEY